MISALVRAKSVSEDHQLQSPSMADWSLLSISSFDEYAGTWDRINESASKLPFLRSAFIKPLLRYFGAGDEVLAIMGRQGSEKALCILKRSGRLSWQTWQPAQLPLGAWVMHPDLSHETLAAQLIRALPGVPLLLSITQQDPAVYTRPANSPKTRSVNYISTGWIDVQGDFDSYWKSRSKKFRQNMRTQRSRLSREGITTRLEVITDPTAVTDAILDFGRLESAGWKGEMGTAVSMDNVQGQFYDAMLQEFCRSGATRIYRYWFHDQVVAVDLCIESDSVQVLLKTTYDESIKGLSPSSLLREEAYRPIFDEGRIRRIEFFGRFMEWTGRWTDNSRDIYHLNCFRWSFVATAAHCSSWLRRLMQRRRPSKGGV